MAIKKIKSSSPAGPIARDCIAVRTRLLNRVITNLYDEALRPLGLKVSQMNILVVAERLGLARPAEVCRILHLDASTLSRNVERMKVKGWLEYLSDEDGRSHPFRVTAKGKKLLGKAFSPWEKAQAEAGELLGRDGVSLLNRLASSFGFKG
jgi:DNA-binding MarR family transcriptional regulator